MFIEAVIIAVIIGYILKGNIRNLENVEINKLYLAFIGFGIEVVINILIMNGLLARGTLTFILDFIMYLFIFAFAYFNKKSLYLIIMTAGFLLNAIPIFLNGGAMPVSSNAARIAGLTQNVTKEGLYRLIDSSTKFGFLGDVIPLTILRHFAISIGDIIAAIGLMLFIIYGMTAKKQINNLEE